MSHKMHTIINGILVKYQLLTFKDVERKDHSMFVGMYYAESVAMSTKVPSVWARPLEGDLCVTGGNPLPSVLGALLSWILGQ